MFVKNYGVELTVNQNKYMHLITNVITGMAEDFKYINGGVGISVLDGQLDIFCNDKTGLTIYQNVKNQQAADMYRNILSTSLSEAGYEAVLCIEKKTMHNDFAVIQKGSSAKRHVVSNDAAKFYTKTAFDAETGFYTWTAEHRSSSNEVILKKEGIIKNAMSKFTDAQLSAAYVLFVYMKENSIEEAIMFNESTGLPKWFHEEVEPSSDIIKRFVSKVKEEKFNELKIEFVLY